MKLIKELNELAKTTRKPKPDERKSTTTFSSKNVVNNPDSLIDSDKVYLKRKSMICMRDNPDVMNKFENIINSINNIVEIM
jgi:hypothetical protein